MPTFAYEAMDGAGTPVSGRIEAANSRAAREQLLSRGLDPHRLAALPEAESVGQRSPLSPADALELTVHVAELTRAEVPLGPGLQALALEMPRGRLATAIARLAGHLDRGLTLDAAVAMPDVWLPAHVQGLLACAQRSGKPGLVLEQFLDHQRLTYELRRRLWSSLAYPLLLLCLLAAWCLFVIEFLVADMLKIFQDFGIYLPPVTEALLWVAEYGPRVAAAGILAGLAALLLLRVVGGRVYMSNLLADLPVFGRLWRDQGLAEFASLLSLLLEHATPLPGALKLAATGLNDAGLADACTRAAKTATAGRQLRDCIADVRPFPASLVPIVAWGDRLSAQPEALRSAAEMFRTRTELRSRYLSIVLPPLTFIIIVVVVLFVIAGLFTPLLQLIVSLSK